MWKSDPEIGGPKLPTEVDMRKRVWFVPLLSAVYWGSCLDPMRDRGHELMSQFERDLRMGICAAALSFILLIIIPEINRACS